MQGLTLQQPWASLIAVGAKTIETRSWRTNYRGPLLIHAGKHVPEEWAPVGSYMVGRVPPLAGEWRLMKPPDGEEWVPLPLGAVVAVADLVDVVPIQGPPGFGIREFPHDGHLPHQNGGLWLVGPNALTMGNPTRVEDQRPYGDYRPGRFAWLLEGVRPVDPPIPAKGRQGLWTPDDALVEQVVSQLGAVA